MNFIAPHELRDLHKDYQPAPEHLQIEKNIISSKHNNNNHHHQRDLLLDEGFSKPPPKLVLNLCNIRNYIIHYRNLKLYLQLRLCLSNTHHILSFHHLPWLKNYINFSTCQGITVKNDFEKDFFKLMNNNIFGKSLLFLGLSVLMH